MGGEEKKIKKKERKKKLKNRVTKCHQFVRLII